MLMIGKWNYLVVLRDTPHGLILDGEDEGDILLPTCYKPEFFDIGEELYVFIYLDSEDRLIATTQAPLAMEGEFAYLQCVDVSKVGAFVDIGLRKDILVPFREQENRMVIGSKYVVYIYLDKVSKRLVASTKLFKWLDRGKFVFQANEEVELLVIEKTDIGYKAIIDQTDVGLIYDKEIFKPIKIGEVLQGYIYFTRPDGKIDLCLHKPAQEKVKALTDIILEKLAESDGEIHLTDKSAPEDIYKMFNVSKKTFKKAIGSLYKERKIQIKDKSICINESGLEKK